MNKVLFILTAALLSGGLLAQESPTTPRAARMRIIQGPTIELSTAYLTIVRWTTNNPGGSPVNYGIVRYGASPSRLTEMAKSPVRLNPGHSTTVFRVRLDNLQPRTTYYFSLDSMGANGKEHRVTSPIGRFSTP
jgi:hypothetical protein